MRTVSYRDEVIFPVVERMGYDPAQDLMTIWAPSLAAYVNAWVRKCWDAADWPELSRTEPRSPIHHLVPYDNATQPPPNWNGTDTFNLDSIVRDPNDSTKIYRSIQNANTNHALTDLSWWTLIPAWDNTKTYLQNDQASDPLSGIVFVAQQVIIPGSVLSNSLLNTKAWQPIFSQQQAQANLTNIGRVLKVYPVDPQKSDGAFDMPFSENDTAIHVGFVHGRVVWIKFMSRPSVYSLTLWDGGTLYNLGDVVYSVFLGECFASAQDSNTNHDLPITKTNNAWWNFVPFPMVIAEPVWRGAYSDALRDEGQTGKAQAEEQAAMQELQLSIARNIITRYDKLTDQQTGVPRYGAMVGAGAS